jgi:hypothetical protein
LYFSKRQRLRTVFSSFSKVRASTACGEIVADVAIQLGTHGGDFFLR